MRRGARLDLDESHDRYEAENPGLGDEFVGEAGDAFQRIADMPTAFPPIGLGFRRALMRRFPFDVYFTANDAEVEIWAIVDQRRDPGVRKGRLGIQEPIANPMLHTGRPPGDPSLWG